MKNLKLTNLENVNITVAGGGYVGLSMACLMSVRHKVCLVDIDSERVDMINRRCSPLKDEHIEACFRDNELSLTATLDGAVGYSNADFVIIAAPTNYQDTTQKIDTTAVEDVIRQVMRYNPQAVMVIKSTVPVGYTKSIR
ncbi:MAG: UDP-glucose 6-dehydrogenase, partial [Blautia wexlerae]